MIWFAQRSLICRILFISSGVAVGTGVDVGFGVAVAFGVAVGVGVDVGFIAAGLGGPATSDA